MSKYMKRQPNPKHKDTYGGAKDRLYSSNDCLYSIFEFLTAWKALKFQKLSWRFYHKIVPKRLGDESVNISKNE